MNRRYLLTSIAALTATLALAFCALAVAGAQGRSGGGNNQAGGPGGQPGFGRPGLMVGGQNGRNPAQSAILALLKRDDVRTELLVTSPQREQLTALDANSQKELSQKMTAFLQNQGLNPQEMQNMTPEERQARVRELQNKQQGLLQSYQNDQENRIAKILNSRAMGGAAQMTRLRQLDLQWRGLLALMDKKVADALALTPDQRAKLGPIFQEYQAASMAATQKHVGDVRTLYTRGGNNGAPPDRAAIQREIQRRVDAAQPEIDKAKKTAGDAILILLTPTQQQQWQEMLGNSFPFRTNP